MERMIDIKIENRTYFEEIEQIHLPDQDISWINFIVDEFNQMITFTQHPVVEQHCRITALGCEQLILNLTQLIRTHPQFFSGNKTDRSVIKTLGTGGFNFTPNQTLLGMW